MTPYRTGHTVLYYYRDLIDPTEVRCRPAVITSVADPDDGVINLHVLFEPSDMPACRPSAYDSPTIWRTWWHRAYVPAIADTNVPVEGTWAPVR